MSATSESPAPEPREDPTQTGDQRASLEQQVDQRTGAAAQTARQQLEGQQPTNTAALAGAALTGASGLAAFRSIGAVRRWLSELLDTFVLDLTQIQQVRQGQHWLVPYVRESYVAGLRQARGALRAQGYDIGSRDAVAVLADDRHQRALADLYENAYLALQEGLDNAADETAQMLADGGFVATETVAGDVDVSEVVETIDDRLEAEYGKRLSPTADTLPARAANTAAMVEYQHAGVTEVGVEPEAANTSHEVDWKTANDGNVCAECLALSAGAPYKLADILNGDPAPPPSPHLRCRCFLLPL